LPQGYDHNKLYEENFDWVKENCRGYFKPMMGWRHYIAFSRKSDAALFTLTFKADHHAYDYVI
jgi:hypothetical protein